MLQSKTLILLNPQIAPSQTRLCSAHRESFAAKRLCRCCKPKMAPVAEVKVLHGPDSLQSRSNCRNMRHLSVFRSGYRPHLRSSALNAGRRGFKVETIVKDSEVTKCSVRKVRLSCLTHVMCLGTCRHSKGRLACNNTPRTLWLLHNPAGI